jgi:hypothetical protein
LIVQDLPETITKAHKNLDPAIEVQAHDFFTPQPIVNSRAYMLHYVLHDWPDDTAVQILENLKPAMKKDYSRLLIVEFVVATTNPDPFNTVSKLMGERVTQSTWLPRGASPYQYLAFCLKPNANPFTH